MTVDGEPLLLVFGPLHFDRSQWEAMVKRLPKQPRIYGLPHLAGDSGLDGAFGWPPVSGGKHLNEREWRHYLENLYAKNETGDSVIAIAFPGFQDIYEQAGLHESYGRISHGGGATFKKTMELAVASKCRVIQIATWNDYGEGTVVEPTRRFGYRFLECIQEGARDTSRYTPEDLRLPILLYQLRKKASLTESARKELDRASAQLFESKCGEARKILETLTDNRAEQSGPDEPTTAPESNPVSGEKPDNPSTP